MVPGDVFTVTSGINGCRIQVYEVHSVHLGGLGQEGVYAIRIVNEEDPDVHGRREPLMTVPIAILDKLVSEGSSHGG